MADVKVKWHGDVIKAKLDLATERIAVRGGNLIRRDAVLNVPKISGDLAGSIELETTPNKAKVLTNKEYAGKVEFENQHLAGHPYLRPALFNNEKPIIKIATSEWGKVVE